MGSGTMGEAALELLATLIADRVAAKLAAKGVGGASLLNVDEVAEKLGRSGAAVRQLIARGELVAVRTGRRVQVEPRELEAYVDRNRTS